MSFKHIKPLGNRVLVKRLEAKTTKGGIFLPESAQEKPKQGKVLMVGPGKVDEKGVVQHMHVRAGDTVLFNSYAGTEVKTDDEEAEYLIMSEDEILGIFVSKS
ncbi:MAG: co-chaperone GroES [Chlamydiae bacterium]|nr:co-chaperone GroES [Chlamydiota bacterium]